MKTMLFFSLTFLFFTAFAQDLETRIAKINTVEEAFAFIEKSPGANAEVLQLNTGTDSSQQAKKIYTAKKDEVFVFDGSTYKIVEIKPSCMLRASYIYLDGTRLSAQQIDSTRQLIIAKYRNGTSFAQLAKEYTMDGSLNCDLGWTREEMLVKDFSTAIKEHKKDEIFTVDVPGKKWYHVVLKTGDDRPVKTYAVLKIKNGN